MAIPYKKKHQALTKQHPLNQPGLRRLKPPNFLTLDRAPTTRDYDNFQVGDVWLDRTTITATEADIYRLVSKTMTAGSVKTAIWVKLFTGTGNVELIQGNTGLPVGPDATDVINFISGIANVSVDGNPGTNTLTINSTGTGPLLETLTPDAGGAVSPDVAGNIDLLGTATQITTTGNPGTNTVTLSLDGAVANSYVTDAGTATPAANVLNVLGGTAGRDTNTTGAGNTVRVELNNAITLGDLAVLGAGVNALSCTTGDINIAAANLKLPRTTSADVGNIKFAGSVYFHNYTDAGAGTQTNLFVGKTCGNYTSAAAAVNNVCCGANSLNSLTTGNHNGSFGGGVLTNTTIGHHNTGCGNNALTTQTTGNYNTCVGSQAGLAITTGSYNTCVGMDSLANLAVSHTGSYNICFGAASTADNYVGAESSNILFSNQGVAAESNTIHFGTHGAGDNQQNRCFVAGIRGITTANADAVPVLIDSAYQLGTVSSALRYKENIFEMGAESSPIYKLRPVIFNYKTDETKSKQYGLIAEEVQEHLPRLVVNNDQGEVETVKYHEIPVLLLNELIKQKYKIDELKNRLRILEEQIAYILQNKVNE